MASLPAGRDGLPRADERIERGDRRRQAILQRPLSIASIDGLEGQSIGRLADELKMSTSGSSRSSARRQTCSSPLFRLHPRSSRSR